MSTYVGDIESNGLLDTITKVHCIVLQDVDTKEVFSYGPDNIQAGLDRMMDAEKLIFHNGIGYDFPALEKVYPEFHVDRDRVIDTLVCTRLIWTDLSDTDSSRITAGKLEPRQRGSHALAAWGKRLGVLKGEFGQSTDWSEWSPELQEYCEQDVAVTLKLWAVISAKEYSVTALDLEHKVAWIIAEQQRHGFLFDVAKAEKLLMHLQVERANIEADLQTIFDPWYSAVEVKTPKRTVNYKNTDKHSVTAGCPYTVVKLNVFNPNSRLHIADRLTSKYGWRPSAFTPDGRAKVDEAILSELVAYPEAQQIAKSLMLQKRIGQLGEGSKAWLTLVEADSRIHGSVNTNGAVTGRMTHNYPNVSQTPSVGKPYGKECRELYMVPKGKKLVGVDVSGLELRMLGHFVSRFDGGAYGHEVVNGDIHTVNMKNAGLSSRGQAKSFIYSFLYGAGASKIGSVIGKGPKEGQKLKTKFLDQTPALARLIKAVTAAAKRGYLVGLDKRLLHCRSSHSALNLLLQAAGSAVCKQWAVEMDKSLVEKNLKHKCQVVANIHDEHQYECDEDIAELVGALSIQAIKDAGKHFNLKVELDGEAKIGNNWYETH
jgi:DNA polymerase I